VSCGSGGLGFSIERFGEIKLRIRLIRIHVHGFLPRIHGFVGMAETGGQQSIVHQGVHVARKYLHPEQLILVCVGDRAKIDPTRFWQWNRYTPVGECNAAMRDGNWKLVRPAISELMAVSREDLAMDAESKYHPQKYTEIVSTPSPERSSYTVPPPQLFNLSSDPLERNNLANLYPERVSKMTKQLAAWFEEVELERRTIND